MSIKYIVVWKSYGDWKGTRPFDSRKEAEDHIDKWLRPSQEHSLAKGDAYHYAKIQVIEIEVDEGLSA